MHHMLHQYALSKQRYFETTLLKCIIMESNRPKHYVAAWREARNMTQIELAERIGKDKSIISKIEKGTVRMTRFTQPALAQALSISEEQLFRSPKDDAAMAKGFYPTFLDPDFQPKTYLADLPVYEATSSGPAGMSMRFELVEWLHRPEPLRNVPSAFAIYVTQRAMVPAFHPGDLVLIHPNRPPATGTPALILHKAEGDSHPAVIGEITNQDGEEIAYRLHADGSEHTIHQTDLHAAYRIIGTFFGR